MNAIRQPRRATLALLVALSLLCAYLLTNRAHAASQPADKVVASGSKVVKFSPGTNETLLTATVKTSNPTDMILEISMECSIITDAIISGSSTPGATQETHTNANVRVWVEVDGVIVPVNSVSNPPQTPPAAGDDSDKVNFCNRTFDRTVTDMESPLNGIDYSRDYIETKAANAFNWLRLNMQSGTHTIVVKGDLTHDATDPSTASAYVGNRSLIAIPCKMANDAVI